MFVYRWEMMRELLERHKDWDGDPYDALTVEYIDPSTGGPVFKTITETLVDRFVARADSGAAK